MSATFSLRLVKYRVSSRTLRARAFPRPWFGFKTDSGIKSETVSNQDGFYALPFLKVGPYEITVEAKGFKIVNQTGIRITVGASERIDFNMEVGQPTESVTVIAEPGSTESPAVATVVDRQLVENLPLNGRSFQSLVELTPGIVLTPTNVTESGQFSVNGQRANANYFTIDGVSANFGVNGSATLYESAGGTLPAYSALGGTNNLVSVDAVQEFRIQTSTYAPEFGRQPGAQFSMVTRSGSNDLHGTAFDLHHPGDLPLRIFMIGTGYLAYFFVISAIVLAVSARSATARQSLVISLALWFGGCVLAPVAAMDLANTLIPAPAAFGYATAEMDANRKLPTVEERRAEVRKRLLARYRVASLRDLPVDPIGIELLEEAEQSDPVFHNLIAGVYDADRRQNRFHQFMGVLFPVIAIQQISMTIAGTDLSAHLDFLDAAEKYRRSMNRMMNEAIAYNPHYKDSAVFPGTDIIVGQAGPDLWRKVPEFRYVPSAVELLWPRFRESVLLLLVWVSFAGLLLFRSTRRLTVN